MIQITAGAARRWPQSTLLDFVRAKFDGPPRGMLFIGRLRLVTGPGTVIEHNRVVGFRDCISR